MGIEGNLFGLPSKFDGFGNKELPFKVLENFVDNAYYMSVLIRVMS